MTTTLKAIWLALKEGDIKSAFKLLNIRKNKQFLEAIDILLTKL